VKILGAIELWKARFHYRQETVFNACTYFPFLEQLARRYQRQGTILIQDKCEIPQRPRPMVMVRCQSPLAGSSSTAALLT
jgi:glutamate racemase